MHKISNLQLLFQPVCPEFFFIAQKVFDPLCGGNIFNALNHDFFFHLALFGNHVSASNGLERFKIPYLYTSASVLTCVRAVQ